jgi:exodeoxyribonuclease VII small subunit
MPRRKNMPPDSSDGPSFEEALSGLETIVEAMEHEQLPLEELVAHYEKGSKLLERCESFLQSARERIELITLRARNETGDDAGDSAPPSAEPDVSDDDDDDIRLF